MTLGERIKDLRKNYLKMTQCQFAERLRLKQNSIAQVEGGRNTSDQTIQTICREFNVSERWLRTGDGDMFAPEPAFDLGEYANRHGMTALETEILKAYLDLDPNVRENLLQHFKERLIRSSPEIDAKTATPTPATAIRASRKQMEIAEEHTPLEQEARAEAEKYTEQIYEQILSEKKAAAGVLSGSSAPKTGDGIAKMA